jgi:hypothetical protein
MREVFYQKVGVDVCHLIMGFRLMTFNESWKRQVLDLMKRMNLI